MADHNHRNAQLSHAAANSGSPSIPRIYLPQYARRLATGAVWLEFIPLLPRAHHAGALSDRRRTGLHITRRWWVRDSINASGRGAVKEHTLFCGSFRQVADQMKE